MKAHFAGWGCVLAVMFLATVFFTGCKTLPSVDWNSRIGTFTYNQALLELGSPEKQVKLGDGRLVVQWITLHGSNGFIMGGGSAYGNYGMGAGQWVGQSYKDHVLELTFSTNSVLLSVAKNF